MTNHTRHRSVIFSNFNPPFFGLKPTFSTQNRPL